MAEKRNEGRHSSDTGNQKSQQASNQRSGSDNNTRQNASNKSNAGDMNQRKGTTHERETKRGGNH